MKGSQWKSVGKSSSVTNQKSFRTTVCVALSIALHKMTKTWVLWLKVCHVFWQQVWFKILLGVKGFMKLHLLTLKILWSYEVWTLQNRKCITLTKILNIYMYTNFIPKKNLGFCDSASACTGKLVADICDFKSSTSKGKLTPSNLSTSARLNASPTIQICSTCFRLSCDT